MFSANLHKDRKKMSLALNSTEIARTYFTAVDSLPDLEPGVNVLASRVTGGGGLAGDGLTFICRYVSACADPASSAIYMLLSSGVKQGMIG